LLSRDIAAVLLDAAGIEETQLALLGGADTLTVRDTTAAGLVRVATDLRGSATTAGDGATDTVIAEATEGDDVVVLTGDATRTNAFGLPVELDVVGHDSEDRLVLRLLGGDDVCDGSALAAGSMFLTAFGGDDDDVLIGGERSDVLLGGDGD